MPDEHARGRHQLDEPATNAWWASAFHADRPCRAGADVADPWPTQTEPSESVMSRALASIIAVLVLAGCAPSPTPSPTPSPVLASPALAATVTVAQAAALRDGGAFVVDVREPDEWAAGHIPEATLIPLGELASRVGELPRDRSIVVVCRSGNRSAQGRDILLGAGFVAVTSLDGGMTDWAAAGMPIETGG
jgi:rhodanese-related sulfurtransferase